MFKHLTLSAAYGLVLASTVAQAQVPAALSLGGHDYSLELQSNDRLSSKLQGASVDAGQHFRGHLGDVADSWVRMSLVNGEWSGVAAIGQQTYIIGSTAQRSKALFSELPASTSRQTLTASLAENLPHTQCGNKHPHTAESSFTENSSSTVKAHSVFEQPNIARADLAELCATTVDGVCMLAEVEFVFDELFQSRVTDPQATANSIINIVEGYYTESFNIEFDVITTEFLDSEVFSSSTDPDILLGGLGPMGAEEDPESIRAMSANNQLPFETSRPALLHVITGRNFDGGTAGIAFTNVLCNNNGFAVGTSQLLGVGSGNEASITAMIVAHEIGHNFGANHDSLDNSCTTGFLMEPSLSLSSAGFSTCSVSEIDTAIDDIPVLGQCFNFPADVSIAADATNTSDVSNGVEFSNRFDIELARAFEAIPTLSVQGNVSDGTGSFTSVLLNGAACSLGTNSQSYTCSENNPGASAILEVSATASTASVAFQHSANFAGSNELVETDSTNNSLTTTVSVTGTAPTPAPNPTPAPTPNPNTGGSNGTDSGGGGGGATGFMSMMLLCAAWFARRLRRLGAGRFALPLSALLLLGACGQVTPLANASNASDDLRKESYTVVQQRSCFCTKEFTRPIKMWVKQERVVKAQYADDDSVVSEDVKRQLLSLEQWQVSLDQWRQHNPNKLEVTYNEETATLSRFVLDPSAMKSDDEFSLTFSDYQPN